MSSTVFCILKCSHPSEEQMGIWADIDHPLHCDERLQEVGSYLRYKWCKMGVRIKGEVLPFPLPSCDCKSCGGNTPVPFCLKDYLPDKSDHLSNGKLKNWREIFWSKKWEKCLETTWEPSIVVVEVSSHGIRVTMSKVRMHKLHI